MVGPTESLPLPLKELGQGQVPDLGHPCSVSEKGQQLGLAVKTACARLGVLQPLTPASSQCRLWEVAVMA